VLMIAAGFAVYAILECGLRITPRRVK
jgi:hypothetical protein